MAIIIKPKNKKQEKLIKDFLDSIEASYHTEAQEDAALYTAMQIRRKSALLNKEEKDTFIGKLKKGK